MTFEYRSPIIFWYKFGNKLLTETLHQENKVFCFLKICILFLQVIEMVLHYSHDRRIG